ncbi:MAG: hypothetical protein ACR2OE_08045 [Thermomicrobiales bacterium]
MTTRITTPDAPVQVDYVEGALTGKVKAGDASMPVQRWFWFDRDIDGTWGVFVETGDSPALTLATPAGTIYADDPAVCAFIDQLAALFADPDAFVKP